MTVYIVDKSDYDTDRTVPAGFSGGTYKFTEGTKDIHTGGPSTLNAWRAQGHPILGAYHVLRTPGNGGNGSLSSQLDFWLSHLDSDVPWWRDVPFILQVDVEKWPYDAVSLSRPVPHAVARATLHPSEFADALAARASTAIAFCSLLNAQVSHGWKICYASRGQYGDSLAGMPIDLWNAHYVGSYPGDTSGDFDPYSGRRPVALQYTSTPFDKNGFPGTTPSLLSRMGGTMTDPLSNPEQAELGNSDSFLYGITQFVTPVNIAYNRDVNSIHPLDLPVVHLLLDLRKALAADGSIPLVQALGKMTDAQYADLKASLLAAMPTAADVASHLDPAVIGAAIASHFHVS